MPFKIEGEFDVLSILVELLGILETTRIQPIPIAAQHIKNLMVYL